ncbi:MAG: hypothetical protein JO060_01020 [Candidatus Eremiobacteraeota bacterium]|nr:hypothetical protein [Candidatus Eremiobacteraeota bacterium]MBV9647986.1 hypothetical protein [Candidatus Eremiobacteraeota bacterium]
MKLGTPEHRDLFCRQFIETHVSFDPERLPWPSLDGETLALLRAFPFWSYAESIEARSARMVELFAHTIDDPLIKEAINVQAVEEYRHERLMSHVLSFYGVEAPALPVGEPRATREDFYVFGFGECTDVFIGFGAFSLAREKEIFPSALLGIFEQLLFEEARHVVFFTNWWRYEETRAGRDAPVRRTIEALKYHAKAALGTVGDAPKTPMPKLEGRFAEVFADVTPVRFLQAALAENRRVMAKVDPRLLRPALMPTLGTLALAGLSVLPPRAAPPVRDLWKETFERQTVAA